MLHGNLGQLSPAEKLLGVNLQESIAGGIATFMASEKGEKLKKEALLKLSIYTAAPYFVAGLLLGFVVFKALEKRGID